MPWSSATRPGPSLFALDIVKPQPLFAGVVEADERLDAAGAVLRPLDEAALAAALGKAAADGFASIAIAFLHADLNAAHERRAGELARAAGFRFVSLSSDVSPLPRFVPRAETTVVDAYLTPVLRSYVEALEAELAGAPLYFMTSAGALVRAGAFRGRDALVSGPAGGVVGVAGDRRGGRRRGGARLRHGRHLDRRLPLRRGAGAARYGQGRRRRKCARRCWTWRRWRPAAARSFPSTACAPGSGR